MQISCGMLGTSSVEEYKQAEEWIHSIIEKLNPDWTDIEKVAYIDNAIGKKISYCPDFDTEVFNAVDARALWKIISSGYGVCNGIANVEQYILKQIGIKTEQIGSKTHAFLKLIDIEIPTEENGLQRGNTILDPTWNLSAHRYGSRPENFCISYEEARKHDIRENGEDTNSHKNDEELQDATLMLDDKSLIQVFSNIGIVQENGEFPIKKLMDQSKVIDDSGYSDEESLRRQLDLLGEYYPEFANCINSTIKVLQGVLLNNNNLQFNRCVLKRVYERNDEDKKPVLYVYVDLPQTGKKFFFADKETCSFSELTQEEFERKFECYEHDLENNHGIRPWEEKEAKEEYEDLTKSSGRIVATEKEEER